MMSKNRITFNKKPVKNVVRKIKKGDVYMIPSQYSLPNRVIKDSLSAREKKIHQINFIDGKEAIYYYEIL